MSVQVDVKVGDHTLLDYMLERVMTVMNEGMREPN
jgi:hypothetical protein